MKVASSLGCSTLACLHTHQINVKHRQREWLPCFGVTWTSLDEKRKVGEIKRAVGSEKGSYCSGRNIEGVT